MVAFSVIMATRNRPSQFREALRSVLTQTCDDIEIIVVNDGLNAKHFLPWHHKSVPQIFRVSSHVRWPRPVISLNYSRFPRE